MKNVYIDYDSLIRGKSNLDSLYNEVHPSYTTKLTPLYEELLKLDDDHDNCFSGEESNLYAINTDINSINTSINELTMDIDTTVNQFLEAELGIIDKITLIEKDNVFGKYRLTQYNTSDLSIQSKGLGTAFLNRQDYSSDIHGIYNNKKDGPLSTKEWKRQSAILDKLMNSGKSEREKAVIYATYIATLYPNKLPYILGGQHCKTRDEYMGLDSTWGYPQDRSDEVQYMDCSAFVLRSLINGGYNSADNKFEHPNYAPNGYDVSAEVLKSQGKCTEFTDNSDVRAGDIVNITGGGGEYDHVGIIIDVDKKGKQMTVAHSSGSDGMNLTTINTETGVVIQDSNNQEREGKPYFQTVTRIPYEDENQG